MWRLLMAGAAVALASGVGASAAEIQLRDGKWLSGRSVERESGNYTLVLDSGAALTIPEELVTRVVDDDASQPVEQTVATATGVDPGQEQVDTEATEERAGGDDPSPPRAEFRSVASFRRDLNDSRWRPESATEPAPSLEEFEPARWYRSPIDAQWKPGSDDSAEDDEMRFGSSSWYRPKAGPGWRPEDGFSDERP